jgi:hypothetical protein
MGDKVDVEKLTGYTGDMTRGIAYHHKWRQRVDVIFHVAPLLESGEHRQFIGNDIGTLIPSLSSSSHHFWGVPFFLSFILL